MISPLPFDQRGFGFIGMMLLLLVTTIGAGVIFTLTVPTASVHAMKTTTDRAASLHTSIANYRLSHGGSTGTFPTTLASLITTDGTACLANNTPASSLFHTLQGWCGPYIDIVYVQAATAYQTDGWGTAFSFNSTTGVLTSCGPDRVCGDGDDLAFNP
jgi:hypothetical protein